jgi:perosamine synthetase
MLSERDRSMAREGFIPLSAPEIRGNEWKYVKECLDTGWVSSAGAFVTRFEQEVAAYVGAAHAVATVNGTAALHMAVKIAGVEPDDEVLVSDLTFVAPVNAIRYCQAHPVLVDADPGTWQMDVDKAARFLALECEVRGDACYNRGTGRRVQAILPVHILGLACEIDRIVALARRYHLRVVEDAAEGMGVRYHGRHVGTFGDVAALSFNGNKIITTGGGGMVVTGSAALAARARYLTTQAKDDEVEYIHHDVGFNYRLTNLQAAVGLAQLEQLDAFVARKRVIARTYERLLGGHDGLTLMPRPANVEPTSWLYTVLLPSGTTVATRKAVVNRLGARGIEARPLWHPVHGLAPYRGCQALEIACSPELYARAVSLPSSVGVTEAELERCGAALREVVGREVSDPRP